VTIARRASDVAAGAKVHCFAARLQAAVKVGMFLHGVTVLTEPEGATPRATLTTPCTLASRATSGYRGATTRAGTGGALRGGEHAGS
jgi:hypothetical protein